MESSELVWLLLTFTSWAFQQVEVEHGLLLKPTRLNLMTFPGKLSPSELRWLVVDVLRSREAEETLACKRQGNLTIENAGAAPRQTTVRRIDERVELFLKVFGLHSRLPPNRQRATPTAPPRTAAEHLRDRLLMCAEGTRTT